MSSNPEISRSSTAVQQISAPDTVVVPAQVAAAAVYPRPAQAWYAVFVLALMQVVTFMDRGILNLLVEPIKHDLKITDTQMSFLMGFAFIGFYMLLALPIARLADCKSRRVIVGVGIGIYSITTAFCGMARSFATLFLCRIGVGVGAACGTPATFSMLADLFPREKLARAMAVLNFGVSAGAGLALLIGGAFAAVFLNMPPKVVPLLGTLHGWQLTLIAVGLPGLLVALLMATVPEPKRLGPVLKSTDGGARKPLPLKHLLDFLRGNAAVFVPLLGGLVFSSIVGGGSRSWGAAFYMRTFHWTATQYGLVQGIVTMTAMPLGGFIGGLLCEMLAKNGRDDANMVVVTAGTILSVPGLILFPLMPTAALSIGVSAVSSFFLGWTAAPMNAALQVITPNQMRGQITALFLFVLNVIGMGIGPTAVALVTDFVFHSEELIGRSMAFQALTLGLIGAVVTCLAVKPYGRAVARMKALR